MKNILSKFQSFYSKNFDEVLLDLAKKDFGMIDFKKNTQQADLPKIFSYIAINKENKRVSFGCDFFDDNLAKLRCLGEFIERMSLVKNIHSFTKGSLVNLKSIYDVSFPQDYHSINGLGQVSEKDVFKLIPVEEIVKNKKVFYPLQFFNINTDQFISEKKIAIQNTSGAAGSFNKKESICSALMEYIERDAFLLYWLGGITPLEIQIEENDSDKINKQVNYLKKYGIESKFYFIKSDINIPVVLAIVKDVFSEEDKKFIVTGKGFKLEDAICSALKEVFQIISIFNVDFVWEELGTEEININNRYKILYKENAKVLNFIENCPKVLYTELKKQDKMYPAHLSRLICHMEEVFGDIDIFCNTNKYGRFFEKKYFVSKLVIPKLLPFYLDEKNGITYSSRVEKFYENSNSGKDLVFKFNESPHPYL